MGGTVRAAGGVLWRPAPGSGIEVAVVHRPRYDDWSLPKGKLERGEQPLAAALREVAEETGCSAVAGRTLGTSRYEVLVHGVLTAKTVRWWALRAAGSAPPPDLREVDEVRWLAPGDAEGLLTAARDVAPLRLLVEGGVATTTVLLVRHASAGDRRAWPGDDALRPLDERGRRQAAALARLLRSYGPVRVLSAPAVRCVQTVSGLGLPVEVDPVFAEPGASAGPAAAAARLRELAGGLGAAVVSSQGGTVPGIVRTLTGRGDDVSAKKGSVWALTFAAGGELVDADHTPPSG